MELFLIKIFWFLGTHFDVLWSFWGFWEPLSMYCEASCHEVFNLWARDALLFNLKLEVLRSMNGMFFYGCILWSMSGMFFILWIFVLVVFKVFWRTNFQILNFLDSYFYVIRRFNKFIWIFLSVLVCIFGNQNLRSSNFRISCYHVLLVKKNFPRVFS